MKAVPPAMVSSRFNEISPRMVLGAIDGTMAPTLIFSSSISRTFFSSRRLLWVVVNRYLVDLHCGVRGDEGDGAGVLLLLHAEPVGLVRGRDTLGLLVV
jgi:hypothetical protein